MASLQITGPTMVDVEDVAVAVEEDVVVEEDVDVITAITITTIRIQGHRGGGQGVGMIGKTFTKGHPQRELYGYRGRT